MREKMITTIQVEGMIYWEVDTIEFRFCWAMMGDINNFEFNDGCLGMWNTKT